MSLRRAPGSHPHARRLRLPRTAPALAVGLAIATTGCAPTAGPSVVAVRPKPTTTRATAPAPAAKAPNVPAAAGPGTDVAGNVYGHIRPADLSPTVRHDPALVYVPNGKADSVDVIDQRTFKTVRRIAVGAQPEHVVPSWDLRSLWVTSDRGNSVTQIDPRTGTVTRRLSVPDPYNMYFTPDGRSAIIVAERLHRLDFRDPVTMSLQSSTTVNCSGLDHADFSGDGRYFIATCEFSGTLVKVDTFTRKVIARLELGAAASPQDIRVGSDGRTFFVADQQLNAVLIVDGPTLQRRGTLSGLSGAHGIYPSRDGRSLYVSDRHGSAVSVVDIARRGVRTVWKLPGGTSPDMGGVSADGNSLWLTNRYGYSVDVIDTRSGRVSRSVTVGAGPHGACVWPQPGRYSLGHTGNMR
jgi:YVTN family beta-propeller protein